MASTDSDSQTRLTLLEQTDSESQTQLRPLEQSLAAEPETAAKAQPAETEPLTPATLLLRHRSDNDAKQSWRSGLHELIAELQQAQEQSSEQTAFLAPPDPLPQTNRSVLHTFQAATKPSAPRKKTVHFAAHRKGTTARMGIKVEGGNKR